MIQGREQLADELLARVVRDANLFSLSNYNSGKSLAEVDAEMIARAYQRELGSDITQEWHDAKQNLRAAIMDFLEVIGA